jgi:uncharacterized PurR-regulated membrane protein YhhQ (DUF165 family)
MNTAPTTKGGQMTRTIKLAAAAGFIGTILAANYVTTHYGMVPVGFGLVATAGTYFAGLAFILRDLVQDTAGRKVVVALIAAGAALSYAVSDPFIATASAAAFLLSEGADLAVYTPLRRRGYVRAAVVSNFVGAVIDTVVFLTIAGFPLRQAIAGQLVGKLAVTLVVVGLVAAGRVARKRQVVT